MMVITKILDVRFNGNCGFILMKEWNYWPAKHQLDSCPLTVSSNDETYNEKPTMPNAGNIYAFQKRPAFEL